MSRNYGLKLQATASELPATLHATTVTVLVGLVILLPSMAYLFVLFQRPDKPKVRG